MGGRADRITVVIVRTGGVAGMRRVWRATAEGDDAQRLETLVESASWESIRTDDTSSDRFVWSITVSGSPGRKRATIPEAELDGALRELIDRVQQLGEAGIPPGSGRTRRPV